MRRLITWSANALTIVGGLAAILSPIVVADKSNIMAFAGGVVALIGAVVTMYSGHLQGMELEAVRNLHKPRTLGANFLKELKTEIAAFAGQRFELYTHNDFDSRQFCVEIGSCLSSAGWQLVPPHCDVMTADKTANLMDVPDTGVILCGPVTGFGEAEKGAALLVQKLKDFGFEAKLQRHPEFDLMQDRIHVFVGLKSRGLS